MSLEENKAIIHGLYEAYNKHNVALLDWFSASDYVHHAQNLRCLENVKEYEAMIFKGFPDLHDTIEDIVAEGDKVWVRTTMTGTHSGEYRGVAPTGKDIMVRCVDIWRMGDGKIVAEPKWKN